MVAYTIKRILFFVPTLVLVTILSFFLSRYTDKDPVETQLEMEGMIPEMATYTEVYKERNRALGYDKPLFYWSVRSSIAKERRDRTTFHYPVFLFNGLDNQYHHWISKFLKGDFGVSIVDGQKASKKINVALKWTLLLLGLNIIFTLIFAVLYGLYCGIRAGSKVDVWTGNVLFVIYSTPTFWLATLLIIFFTTNDYGMKLFPDVGIWYGVGGQTFLQMLSNKWGLLLLPLVIMVVKDISFLGRMIRDTVQQITKEQYATTAKSKGMGHWRYAFCHILPNALSPAITQVIGAVPTAFGGSLLLEVIFNIPGMGRLLYMSIYATDYDIVFYIIILIAIVTVACYLLGDLIIRWLNPKLRYA